VALRSLSLCAGIGGIDLGLAEWARSVCFVEREAFAASVLVARMEEAALDLAPIWSDLRTFDARAWRGSVDLVTGGYPCQPFSVAGKRLGDEDGRHLWPEVRRILSESGACLGFFENVAGHVSLGLSDVLADLAALGFDAEWTCLRASDVGAPHRRERLFILAYRGDEGRRKLADAQGCDGRLQLCQRGSQPSGSKPRGCGEGLGHAERARRTETGSGPALDAGSEPEQGCGALEHAASRDARSTGSAQHGDGRRAGTAGAAMGDAESTGQLRAQPAVDDRQDGARGVGRADDDDAAGADLGHPGSSRLEERRPLAIPRALTAAWPPGPSDRDGWERWVRGGGPRPVVVSGFNAEAAELLARRSLRCVVPGINRPARRREAARLAAELVRSLSAKRAESELRRSPDELSALVDRADRLRALGNAVVPAQARAAFVELARRVLT